MFALKAEIDSKEVNEWKMKMKKSKSRREAEGRDLLLVRHAVPKINSGLLKNKNNLWNVLKK